MREKNLLVVGREKKRFEFGQLLLLEETQVVAKHRPRVEMHVRPTELTCSSFSLWKEESSIPTQECQEVLSLNPVRPSFLLLLLLLLILLYRQKN